MQRIYLPKGNTTENEANWNCWNCTYCYPEGVGFLSTLVVTNNLDQHDWSFFLSFFFSDQMYLIEDMQATGQRLHLPTVSGIYNASINKITIIHDLDLCLGLLTIKSCPDLTSIFHSTVQLNNITSSRAIQM